MSAPLLLPPPRWMSASAPTPSPGTHTLSTCERLALWTPPPRYPSPLGEGGKGRATWPKAGGHRGSPGGKTNQRSRVGELDQRADGWDKNPDGVKRTEATQVDGKIKLKSSKKWRMRALARDRAWERERKSDLSCCLSGVNLLKNTQTTCLGWRRLSRPTSP